MQTSIAGLRLFITTTATLWAENPGPALSVSMGDVPDDGYKTFVCVETACVSPLQKASAEKPSRLAQTISIVKG